ncbi:MAG: dihydrolipoyl dehydrogenase family protein [Anaerolineae bacterium]
MAGKHYDVLVIGTGAGAIVAERAQWAGQKVALVDRGPLGGTCLNVGCIPSKMLILPADRIIEARRAARLGVYLSVTGIDVKSIMERMRAVVTSGQQSVREGLRQSPDIDYYEATGHFVGEHEMEVAGARVSADKVFIAAGARPSVPSLPGLRDVDYLTNESILALDEMPHSIIVVGGGYVGAEYAHFLSAVGSQVTLVEMGHRLVAGEEPEVSMRLKNRLAERMTVLTDTAVTALRRTPQGVAASVRNQVTGSESTVEAASLLLATGRTSNADLLRLEATGVALDGRGYVAVDGYLQTSKANIWAFGDVIGRRMFTHVANQEAIVAWHNSQHDPKVEMDYNAAPHAIFSDPQIASVGLTEAEARATHDILVGEADYQSVAYGEATAEVDGYAKAVVEKDTGRILGFHIAGSHAAMLIQEVTDVMANEGNVNSVLAGMHIHPALSEIVPACLHDLHDPEHRHEGEHEATIESHRG